MVAKQLREIISEERAKNKIMQLHRWDILRRKKSEATTEAYGIRRNSYKLQKLVKLALVWNVLRDINDRFRARIAWIERLKHEHNAVSKILTGYRIIM